MRPRWPQPLASAPYRRPKHARRADRRRLPGRRGHRPQGPRVGAEITRDYQGRSSCWSPSCAARSSSWPTWPEPSPALEMDFLAISSYTEEHSETGAQGHPLSQGPRPAGQGQERPRRRGHDRLRAHPALHHCARCGCGDPALWRSARSSTGPIYAWSTWTCATAASKCPTTSSWATASTTASRSATSPTWPICGWGPISPRCSSRTPLRPTDAAAA